MKTTINVDFNFVVKAVWLPRFGPIRYRNRFTKAIQLKTATSDGIHNRSIMNDLELNIFLFGAYNKVGVRCGTKWITDNE